MLTEFQLRVLITFVIVALVVVCLMLPAFVVCVMLPCLLRARSSVLGRTR